MIDVPAYIIELSPGGATTRRRAAGRDVPTWICTKTRYIGLAVKWTETVSRQAYAVRPPVYSIVYDEN